MKFEKEFKNFPLDFAFNGKFSLKTNLILIKMKIQPKINGSYLNTRIQIKETPTGQLVSAANGLHADGAIVKLGGTLTENTSVVAGNYKLSFDKLNIANLAGSNDRMVIAHSDGSLDVQAVPSGGSNVSAGNGLYMDGSTVKIGGTIGDNTRLNVSNFLHLTGNFTYAPNMFVGQVANGNSDAVYPLLELNSGQTFVVQGGGTVSFNLPDPTKPMIFNFVATEKALFFIGQQNQMKAIIRYVDSTQYYKQISNVKSLTPITTTRAACTIMAINGEWQIMNVTGTWYDEGNNPIQ